jgi:hypothetical protein
MYTVGVLANKDLGDELNRVGANPQCPVCDNEQWGISPLAFALAPIENGRVSAGRAASVRALTCTNCGFVRLHDPNSLG